VRGGAHPSGFWQKALTNQPGSRRYHDEYGEDEAAEIVAATKDEWCDTDQGKDSGINYLKQAMRQHAGIFMLRTMALDSPGIGVLSLVHGTAFYVMLRGWHLDQTLRIRRFDP
jgi:hypothetical protein